MLNQPKNYNPYEDESFTKFCENECEHRFDSEAPFTCICPYLDEEIFRRELDEYEEDCNEYEDFDMDDEEEELEYHFNNDTLTVKKVIIE
jgi:hypothetical protein